MEETPVGQEDPPNTLPLHCVIKEESPHLEWQPDDEEISTSQNSKYLFLTVEYVDNVKTNGIQFNNYTSNMTGNGKISQLDPNLSSSGRYSPLYNTLVIPSGVRENFGESVVVVPTTDGHRHQINIFVDQSEGAKQLVVEESNDNNKIRNYRLRGSAREVMIESQPDFDSNLSSQTAPSILDEKVIITAATDFVSPDISDVRVDQGSDVSTNVSFLSGKSESTAGDEFPSPCGRQIEAEFAHSSSEEVLLAEDDEGRKTLLDSSEFVIQESDLKQDELLLPPPEQNNDLLMNHTNLEVDGYSLSEETYSTPDDGNTYAAMEEQLNITIGKPESEYLLPDTIPFEDAETSILQSNLEVFASQEIENSELLLYDKTRLRPPKKHVEHLGLEYWCDECDDALGVKCLKHEVKVIPDKPILSRARATLPKEYLAINKLNGGTNEEGVFARKTIPKRTQFGPVEGILMKDMDECGAMDRDSVELLLEVETGEFLKLDVSNEEQSNWMRFVRPAKNIKEQNLVLTQQGISLYFTTTEAIPPRHELKVGYSPQYAEKRKLEILQDLSWTCFECPAKFSSSSELQKHLYVHEGDKEYDNFVAKRKAKSLMAKTGVSNMLRGLKGSNRNRSERIEKSSSLRENECWSCHRTFPRTYSLKRHLLLVHAEKDKENSGILLDGKSEKDGDKSSIVNTLFKKKSSNGTGSEWLCTHCNLTFDNPSVLNLHTLTHAAEDLESEAVSGLPSELSSVYHEGEFLVQNGDVQCPQCTKEFPSKRELIDHVSTHGKMTHKKCCSASSKPFKCEQCYKTFASDSSLQKHMLVHGADETKPYQCDTCFKRFLNNSALSCHLKTHCDKKCFECPICKEEFGQVFGLKEHVKVHSAGGRFTCPHCNKVFDGYSVIRKHIRAFHSGHQHICKDCGKLCPTLDKLRMHSLKHSDHREFLCANCGKQFKRKDKLKEHMKRMHSAEREMKLLSSALRIPNTKDRRFPLKMSPMAYDRFIYKCRNCMVGFKRRGMLVNHLAKRHPDIVPDTVPELNLPILKTTRDYFCQYCDKIYKSSSKRKAHILKNHPGAELPMSNRQKGGIPDIPGVPNPTFSQTVGSVKTTPHGCQWCHKQYASKAKLLQHQRKKHVSLLPQAQQVPRPARNANSPVGSEIVDSTLPKEEKMAEEVVDSLKVTGHGQRACRDEGACAAKSEMSDGISSTTDVDCKKATYKGVHDNNMSNDFLQQAMMTELTQTFTDYKLTFSTTTTNSPPPPPQTPTSSQDHHLLKMIGVKEGLGRDDIIPGAQVSRAWPSMPPFPPR